MLKLTLIIAALALVSARPQDGHGHGHAVSSQSIVLHTSHGHEHQGQAPAHHQILTTQHFEHGGHYDLGHHEVQHHGYAQVHHHEHQPIHHGLQQVQYHGHQDDHHHGHEEHHVDYHAHPKYAFEYKVEDPHTGDNKYQHETRDGDVVKGVYSLHEADGTIRTVKYAADKHSGFNAEVHREGHAKHVVPEHQHGH
ncbi:cuticular protein RR-2 motif 111 precursor [Bombyx mori]|uniref:Putative cuticle protein n=1 Tax=Bombyx mori TaxID=7091 RepID=C0H6V3_BOMMO|nr:cuticular protein RR-2 motif 111 precursor [Bombyx mori]FAA00614.1 TPA: putative cuticle protein [Bombyx mori]